MSDSLSLHLSGNHLPSRQDIFPACYLAPVPWYAAWLNAQHPVVEVWDWYKKQRLSSRTWLRTDRGCLALTIPVERRSSKCPIAEKRVSYQENWPEQHFRSWQNYYRHSPFLEFYEDSIRGLYAQRPAHLLDWHRASHVLIADILRIPSTLPVSGHHLKGEQVHRDLRADFSGTMDPLPLWFHSKPYAQVYEGFYPGLSVLDLILMKGPEAKLFLQGLVQQEHR